MFLKGETPGHATPGWAETPRTDRTGGETPGATPTPGSKRRSRWDETPASQMGGTTPMIGTSGVTPAGPAAMQMQTPTPGQMAMTPEQMQAYRWEREIDERNRYLSDDELDAFFPKEGYKVWSLTCICISIAKISIMKTLCRKCLPEERQL